ncbi:Lipid II flippase FtsW [Clostridium liquoris]|jgi:cell division protein FtsW|uniref:Probable peptidoglycan glycosyltransferase FtsW n=1 Tax=Clostridium liquoris TaxID=1289519 RepID=A0A2T0B4G4_9CLOT|nr:stage V sporulation protein E [Clostridium liquoris]PRR78752.1 Lipid II flippase FtsW [Clostridium liquoris]
MKKLQNKMSSIDFLLFSVIMLLVALGVVMVYSASSYFAFYKYKDSMYFLKRQALWAAIGIFAMFVTINIDYHKYKKYTKLIMIITTILLCVVFLFPERNGARRWIPLGPASLQPSEIAKYAVVLYLAKSIDAKGEKIKSFFYGVIPYLLVAGFYAGLVYLEKNLSIATVIMAVTFFILFVAGAKLKHLATVVLPVILAGMAAILLVPFRRDRFFSYRNPWVDPQKTGYQLIQSFLALGSGGIWGVGLGQSRQKCYYIPEPHNDFIFAVIGEELGLIGCTFVIILFVIFIWRGVVTAVKAKDTFGTLLATGITSVIAVQALINIAVVTGSIPVTGVPLPFISYGGSSLLVNMTAMGVLLNISRQKSNI